MLQLFPLTVPHSRYCKVTGNGNKCLAGMGMVMGMALKLVGIGRDGKAESHSNNVGESKKGINE